MNETISGLPPGRRQDGARLSASQAAVRPSVMEHPTEPTEQGSMVLSFLLGANLRDQLLLSLESWLAELSASLKVLNCLLYFRQQFL